MEPSLYILQRVCTRLSGGNILAVSVGTLLAAVTENDHQ